MFGRRKKKERKAEEAASAEELSHALTQLDLFGERLDELKQSYNDQARTLAQTPTPVPPPPVASASAPSAEHIPTPALAFMPALNLDQLRQDPPPPPTVLPGGNKPRGRYSSITTETSDANEEPVLHRAVEKEEEAQPRSRAVQFPLRSRSGRFYLQLSEAANTEALRKAREQVSKFGRVVDSGRGTASDPKAGWLEVAVREEDKARLVANLEAVGVKGQVDKLVEVDPGEGRLQARQYELFRKRADSGSGR